MSPTNPTTFVLGVAGFAQTGKDTLADLLVVHYDFVKMSFATPMRAIAEAVDPVVGVDGDEVIRYTDAIEKWGYEDAKVHFPEIRTFLQRLGTDGGRSVLGESVWVDYLMARLPAGRVVIPDMRFWNEAEAIKARGGRTLRVERPNVKPPNAHVSEHDLVAWSFDGHIHNNTRPADMLSKVDAFFARHEPMILRVR